MHVLNGYTAIQVAIIREKLQTRVSLVVHLSPKYSNVFHRLILGTPAEMFAGQEEQPGVGLPFSSVYDSIVFDPTDFPSEPIAGEPYKHQPYLGAVLVKIDNQVHLPQALAGPLGYKFRVCVFLGGMQTVGITRGC